MSSTIETQIIKLLKRNDQYALNLLYENYSDSLYGAILKVTKNEEIAEDALQETFIKVWKNAQKYDPTKAKLFTWLFRIARNTAIDKLRSFNNRFHKEVQIDKSNVYILPGTNLNQDVLDIREHVSGLEEKYQIVLNALFFEGMTQQEASDELEIPLGTVKSRLKIGLRELRKVYDF
ncbi:MAG: RNA polymerase sigma factor [Winogradskyella sp.]|uniref:RNA polymerase sigma factor n=1 Tax=Winogradskyella sp. TaxID=1883156 RepID=UPI000F40D981|nr:RNA polymerase sigma factor [Winogradskyella sp.]RNC85110.1 MAG: RNA polymerase sigma factor [Winogradskyella sp.]